MASYNQNNKHGLRLYTPELRQEAFVQYCDHIARGWEKKSWYFEHPTVTCSWATMEKTMLDYADEFDLDLLTIAQSRGLREWEHVIYGAARGELKFVNSAALTMIWRNKFGWDRPQTNATDADTLTMSVQHNQECIIAQLDDYQTRNNNAIEINVEPV